MRSPRRAIGVPYEGAPNVVDIFTRLPSSDPTVEWYNFDDEAGSVSVRWRPNTGTVDIWSINVDQTERRRGIGRSLARTAIRFAQAVGAEQVTARIISRESYEMFRGLYGPEFIQVEQLGSFEADGRPVSRTEARFTYELPSPIVDPQE